MKIHAALLCMLLAATAHSQTPVYTIEQFGLRDADHVSIPDNEGFSTPTHIAADGTIVGSSRRNDSSDGGVTTWVYKDQNLIRIGLDYDDLSAGHRGENRVRFVNSSGQVGGSTSTKAWFFDGTTTERIGLLDPEHTGPASLGRSAQITTLKGLNDSGQLIGAAARFGAAGEDLGSSAWRYAAGQTQKIGLLDAEHTNSVSGYSFNQAAALSATGTVAGGAYRFGTGGTDLGRSLWVFDGTATQRIGLTDAEHTRSTDGRQYSVFRSAIAGQDEFRADRLTNAAGQVAGFSQRFSSSGANRGSSAWLYDGTATINVGLIDTEHTRSNGFRDNQVRILNERGDVAGTARRFNGQATSQGYSAWLYNGSSTVKVGLQDAEHTSSTSGEQWNRVAALNDSGQAAGNANRYAADGSFLSTSTWLYDGTQTQRVGLLDAAHTSAAGVQNSEIAGLTNSGFLFGKSCLYGQSEICSQRTVWRRSADGTTEAIGLAETGSSVFGNKLLWNETGLAAGNVAGGSFTNNTAATRAWYFDGEDTVDLSALLFDDPQEPGTSAVNYLGEDGMVFGTYTFINDGSPENLVTSVFGYSDELGLFDLALQIDGSYAEQDWDYLNSVISVTEDGSVVGAGAINGGGFLAFQATVVPVPGAVWLFGSALAGLGWLRGRQRSEIRA